jgi:hypothetical protein
LRRLDVLVQDKCAEAIIVGLGAAMIQLSSANFEFAFRRGFRCVIAVQLL